MKTLKALVFAFCLPFLLVACGTFSNKVAQMGSRQYITETVDKDKLIALGQVKSDGNFVAIGEKYLYVITDKDLNSWLSKNKDKFGKKGGKFDAGVPTITLSSNDKNKGTLFVYIARYIEEDDVIKGGYIPEEKRYINTNENGEEVGGRLHAHTSHNAQVELYKRTNEVPVAYQFKSDIEIEIKKGHYTTPTSDDKVLSTVLLPFAAVADILLLQLDPNVTGYNPPK